jgi:CP family cyanate transporter-like MFS transporter
VAMLIVTRVFSPATYRTGSIDMQFESK